MDRSLHLMQNGVDKHMNQTIQEWVMAMLQQTRLKLEFWVEPMQTVVYLINLSREKKSSFECHMFYGR